MKTYFERDKLEALLKIEMPFKKRFSGYIKGSHRSSATGKNIDFKEHRIYTQGDDISQLDWKLFARTEKLYTKQYEENTSCRIMVLLDKSASMDYSGSNLTNKIEYAKYLFSLIFSLFVKQGDKVGLSVFDKKTYQIIPFSQSNENLSDINKKLSGLHAEGTTDFLTITSESVGKDKKTPDIIFIISDMITNSETILRFIKSIKSSGNEIILFQLIDNNEEFFSFSGEKIFYDNETGKEILLDADSVKELYLNYYQSHVDFISKYTEQVGCQYFRFSINIPYFENFMKFVMHYRMG